MKMGKGYYEKKKNNFMFFILFFFFLVKYNFLFLFCWEALSDPTIQSETLYRRKQNLVTL